MRHAMIAMARAFIMATRAFADAERALAQNSDHSVDTENSHYAIKFGDVTRLTNFKVCECRWVSRKWQGVLGLCGPLVRPLIETALLEDEDFSTRVLKLVDVKLSSELSSIVTGAIKTLLPDLIAQAMSTSIGQLLFPIYLTNLLTFNI